MSKINKKRPIYVLDTNVLLYNPRAVYAFPNADVVIPDTVLGELDKVKTSRADRELRYRSREISRILFELSENGKLTDGIPFGKNSVMRVISFDPSKGKPDMFGSKNSDDRILSVVYQLKQESNGRPVTIVTNDLNMLLKAQTLEIKVEHPGEEFAYGGVKRALFLLKAKRRSIATAAVVAAMIAMVAFLPQIRAYLGADSIDNIDAPASIAKDLKDYQNRVNAIKTQQESYEAILAKSPKDFQALVGMASSYFELGELSEDPKNYQKAVDYYKRALDVDPKKSGVRTDMAIAYSSLGLNDIAKRELSRVIEQDKRFYQAHFNMGVILYQGDNNPQGAKPYLEEVLKLAPEQSGFYVRAQSLLEQINAQLQAHEKSG